MMPPDLALGFICAAAGWISGFWIGSLRPDPSALPDPTEGQMNQNYERVWIPPARDYGAIPACPEDITGYWVVREKRDA